MLTKGLIMTDKRKNKITSRSKYFKWGLTAYLVILACIITIFIVFNSEIFFYGLKKLINILMPIIYGIIVAYLLSPLIDKEEEKWFIPLYKKLGKKIEVKEKKQIRIFSVLVTFLGVILVVYVFIKGVIPQLIESIQNIIILMPTYLDNLIKYINVILEKWNLFKVNDINVIVEEYYEDIMEFASNNILPGIANFGATLTGSVFRFLKALLNFIIGLIISIYLLCAKETFIGQFKKLIFAIFKRERANLLLDDIRFANKTFNGFIVGKIIDSIIIGLICFIILTICGIPYAILISVIIGVTNIIPFFGPIIGAVPCTLLILLVNPIQAVYLIIIIIILQQFDGNILGPMILGNSTGLSGFWVIFAITVFGGLWGVTGMFLGVPVFACIYAWIKRRIKYSLIKKDLSNNTSEYIDAIHLNSDNTLKYNEKEEVAIEPNYIVLQDNSKNKGSDKPKTIKSFFKNLWTQIINFIKLLKKK